MNAAARKTDKQRLAEVIDAVCADLQALKARIHPSEIRSLALQADSFEAYEDYARDIIGFTNDLRVEAIIIAAELGNQTLSAEAFRHQGNKGHAGLFYAMLATSPLSEGAER